MNQATSRLSYPSPENRFKLGHESERASDSVDFFQVNGGQALVFTSLSQSLAKRLQAEDLRYNVAQHAI